MFNDTIYNHAFSSSRNLDYHKVYAMNIDFHRGRFEIYCRVLVYVGIFGRKKDLFTF